MLNRCAHSGSCVSFLSYGLAASRRTLARTTIMLGIEDEEYILEIYEVNFDVCSRVLTWGGTQIASGESEWGTSTGIL